jgi:hypothetical protein
VVLTGVSAAVATTLTELGIDLRSLQVARSPREVLAGKVRGPAHRLL